MIHDAKFCKWQCDDCGKMSGIVKSGVVPAHWKMFRSLPPLKALHCCGHCARLREGPLKKRAVWKIRNNKESKRTPTVHKTT